jgi:hypothetical protein
LEWEFTGRPRIALTATTDTILTRAPLTATTVLLGFLAACSSALARGMGGAGRATGDVAGGVVGVAGAVDTDTVGAMASLADAGSPVDVVSRVGTDSREAVVLRDADLQEVGSMAEADFMEAAVSTVAEASMEAAVDMAAVVTGKLRVN